MAAPRILYHSADPQNLKTTYTSSDQCDFLLSYEGRSLELGSVRLEAELEVTVAGELFGLTGASTDSLVYMDTFTGAHAVIQQISTDIGGTMVETVPDYPRLVKAITTATQSQTDMFNSGNVCELKTPSMEIAREVLMGEHVPITTGTTADDRINPDFSIKPLCSLNKAGQGQVLPYRKSGDVRVTINLARAADVLFGRDMGGTVSYVLRNLRCTFRSVPDQGPKFDQPIVMQRHISMKHNIASTQANIQMKVPAVCDSFICTFLPKSEGGKDAPNVLALARPPGISEVQYMFNDATNQYITYRLTDQVQWLGRYLDSFQDSRDGTNAAKLGNVFSNQVFGLGLSFGGPIDLSRQKLSIAINSAVTNTSPYSVYLYFSSMLTI